MNTFKTSLKIKISILILSNSSTLFAQSITNSFVFFSEQEQLSSGLNPVTSEPLPGSDWTVKYSTANIGTCAAFASDGHIYNDGLIFKTKVSYKDKTSLDCSGLTIDDDPNNIVTWIDQGVVQESFFPDEILSCGIGTMCDANQNIIHEGKNFATINPTAGGNATSSGKSDLFLYNFKSLTNSGSNGSAGIGGKANLPKNPSTTKYCLYLRDVTTDNRTSSYAKNPEVSLRVITWKPIQQGPNASNGTGVGTVQKTTVIKGLDSSQRYWIGRGDVLGE